MSTITFAPIKELETLTTFEEGFDDDEELDIDELDEDDEFDELGEDEDGEGGNDHPKKPGFDLDPFGEPIEEF